MNRDQRAGIGVGLFGTEPVGRTAELVGLAEELGFENVWIGDSQNIWRDAYVTLGAVAAATERIILGTGVTNAVTRHFSVIASAWATLSELAPGRVAFAIGTGDSSLRTMGMIPQRVADLEQRILSLRSLLAGEEVVDPDSRASFRLHFAPEQRVPIYVAAASPRSLRMAGRVADGVVMCVGVDRRLVDAALTHLAAGAREAGRSIDSIRIVLWTALAIEDDGVSARDLVRAFTASAVIPPLVDELDGEERDAIKVIRAHYDYEEHMRTNADHRELVPDQLVRRFAIAGTPLECDGQLKKILSFPIDQLSVVPFGADRATVMRRLASLLAESGAQIPADAARLAAQGG